MSEQELTLPGYEILGKIGEGGMGTVYRARQLSLDRLVAIKVLLPKVASDAEFAAKFLHEARAAAKLSHPNIVQAIEAGDHGDIRFFVMELVEGGTLHDRLAQVGKMREAAAIEIARQIAQALDFAWRRAGIIHRDIKPANILLTADGQAKVADLGLARRQGTFAATGFAEGTPQYCAPEQCRDETNIDIRTDLYALGCTLYHMVCGRPPFDDDDAAKVMAMQVNLQPKPPREIDPIISPALEAVILKLLVKDPAGRFQSPEELLRELNRLHKVYTGQSDNGNLLAAASSVPVAQPVKKKRSLLVPVAVAGVVLLAGGVGWMLIFKPVHSARAPRPAARVVKKEVLSLQATPEPTTNVATTVVTPAPATNAATAAVTEAEPTAVALAKLSQIEQTANALSKGKKYTEAEAIIQRALNEWTGKPKLKKRLEALWLQVQSEHIAYEKERAEAAAKDAIVKAEAEKTAKAAAETRERQLQAQTRAAIAPVEPVVRAFYFERGQKYLVAVAAQTTDADLRARIQARADELQLLVELKGRLIAAIGKGVIPQRTLALARGGALEGRPAAADADSLSILVGAGSIAMRWNDFQEPTLYDMLRSSISPQDGRALAAMALYAWETRRASDAKKYLAAARAVLGEANLPAPVKRRAAG